MVAIQLHPYNPAWPTDFLAIKAELTHDLSRHGIHYTSIEHIGSTAVPGLIAKPIIDILVVIPPSDFGRHVILQQFRGALMHGERQGGYYYIGNGGVQGRWSFKLRPFCPLTEDPADAPAPSSFTSMEFLEQQHYRIISRHVYVAAEGSLVHRNYLALRDTLRADVGGGLRDEYARVKVEAAGAGEYDNVMQYATRKNGVVRKILQRAGWSEEEVDEKERGAVKDWPRRGVEGVGGEGGFFEI